RSRSRRTSPARRWQASRWRPRRSSSAAVSGECSRWHDRTCGTFRARRCSGNTGTMNPLLPAVLSTTAGAGDGIGFLALAGLFTAHITGNLVVLATHYVTGDFGEIGPLLAAPVFILVLGAVMLVAIGFEKTHYGCRRALLSLQVVLLAACLAVGV